MNTLQISRISADTEEAATVLGLQGDQEATMIAIAFSVKNTGAQEAGFFLTQSSLITNTGEAVSSDLNRSDLVGRTFAVNEEDEDEVYYICICKICKNSPADAISHIQLWINAPIDSEFHSLSEDILLEIDLARLVS